MGMKIIGQNGLLTSGAIIGATSQRQIFTTGVGVGASPPAAMLGVIGADSLGTSFAGNISGATGTGFVVTNANNVGIGTTAPGAALDVVGAGRFSNGLTVTAGGETITAGGLLVTAGRISTGQAIPINVILNVYGNQDMATISQYGAYIHPFFSTSATSNVYGLRVGGSTGASTSNAYSTYIGNNTVFGAGTIANNYGLYIEAITGGTSTNYSLYSAGTANSYFAGNVGIGTTSSGAKLSVSGGLGIGSTYATTAVADGNLIISGNVGIGTTNPTAALHVPASSTARASLRIPAGTAPTIPNAGDVWAEGTVIKFYNGTTTKEIAFV